VCGEAKLRQTDKETELMILKARGRIEVEVLVHRSGPVPPVPLPLQLAGSTPYQRRGCLLVMSVIIFNIQYLALTSFAEFAG
jgi:hypothetical protein